MDGWKDWIGKKIYIKTVSGKEYTGEVIDVEINNNPRLIWITLIDKFKTKVMIVNSEISIIREDLKEVNKS